MLQAEKLMQSVQDTYLRVNQKFKVIIDSDPTVLRDDSARGLVQLILDVKTILNNINQMSIEDRAKHFNITYNAIIYISDIASLLKKSNYSFETIRHLTDCALAMQANIILQDIKYLDKRTKIYLDICHIYEENECLEPAVAILDSAIQKYKQLKAIHEMDPPLPSHVETILTNNLRILKVMWIKYSIQTGTINPNDWRKKVDEQFADDVNLKLLSLVQCLRTETRKQSNIFQKNPHSALNKNYKQILVQAGYDLIKPHLDIIQRSLNEQKAKIQREVTFKNTMEVTQQLINEEIKKKREIEQKYVKINDFRKASNSFPFEYHTELIHYAYEVKNNKVLMNLLEVAMLRAECRRIQMPYINDVGIIASSTMSPNIPNGYEKLPIDLNEANLRIQLKKLRKKNEGKGVQQQKPPVDQKDSKDNKKGAKDPKAPVVEQPKKQNKDAPTQWQLQQINHKYVYMIIKRTMSPENAVYDLNVVMGDEEEGPAGYMDTRRIIVPYIQEDMNVQESKVKQYKGIKESTSMVPYIIMKHSKTGLEDEEEKKNVIIDVKPLIGKNPIIPPSWGYEKVPIDLRQVPEQFLKNSNHDYVYMSFKRDSLFFSCQRHVKILNSLADLENSSGNIKPQNSHDQKLIELGITYNLEKLNSLFVTLQECLDGKLGQDYYILRCDFLTHLTYYLWAKYLRGQLMQFDYVNEMRLNQQLVDYDYQFYRETLLKCKPVFLNGCRVFNFIMINNQKSDILLLSRINLQLLKLLEEQKQYKQTFQNAKMCLDRIRQFRDNYLTQGLKGSQNKLLPFSITCSNLKIKETLQKMQIKFREQRNYIRKLKRIEQRKKVNKLQELNEEELQQEENQFVHFQKKDEIDQTIEKVGTTHIQIISVMAGAELDIYNFFFRAILKHAQLLRIIEKQSSNNVINGIKESTLHGLATSIKNKLSLMSGKNEQKNQKNLKELQSTLIQAEKLPPPKPQIHWLEKKTMEEYSKNPYAMALLMGNFAAMNSQNEDKKYFLQEALENIKKCLEQEKTSCQLAINNAIFIYSTLWDDEVKSQASSSAISPFKQLYDGIWPSVGPVPNQPILISKSSTSISMKIPPFKIASEGKKKKTVKSMSIYGKPSANGVDVSTNCNQLEGTGIKNRIDEVVRVNNLKPNNIYCFAVAATNEESELQPIGKTCGDIRTSNPLPISMLASYISKTSYQINQFETAYAAAKIVIDQVCELSSYQSPDSKTSLVYMYRLKEAAIASMPLLEIRSVVETLYIMALCERKKLIQFKENNKDMVPIVIQQKEQRITNWLMLASLLNPCLTSPLVSIPFLIPEDFIVLKALSLSLIPPKWMNSKLRELGVKVMEKVLKWGLEKNQIGLARRIVYRWTERKWLMLGKMSQIEQKKDVKKGAKDSKDQQVKLIDKYCRHLVEKSPGQMQLFEDSLAVISQEYSDFTNLFVEKGKEQITYYSQFVDNAPEELEAWINKLSSKTQLAEYLKDPFNSIKKVTQASPFYLEFNCKILRKALQISAPTDSKQLLTKAQQLTVPTNNKQITLSKEIQSLMLEAILNNIQWIPSAKNDIIRLQEKTGKNLSKEIQLYSDFEAKMTELSKSISKMDSLVDKYTDFDYLNIWLSELYYLKALIFVINCGSLTVKNPVKGRFDKVRLMNLQDLLKKKKEIDILDKQSVTYSQQELKTLNQILKLLCDAAYSSFCIENWIKLLNVFRILSNFISKHLITPFYHKDNNIWQYFTFLSLLGVLMLKRIRSDGFETFRKRYKIKQSRTQLKIVATKLGVQLQPQQMVQIFEPKYFMPSLDPNTTKNYWFEKESRIDLQVLGSIMAYTVQTLRLENKYNLVINLSRDFCNMTQHYHSLEFLPFMIQSQQKLIDQVKQSIDKQSNILKGVVDEYTKKKSSKMKGERQHKLTNEPLPYEIEYEEKRKKILESMELLSNHRNFLQAQIDSSQTIIEQIKRDTSKTVLKQRDQRKFMSEFGDDEEHMFKNYGDDTRLAKNRKNAVKDIIQQYDKIYRELKNNKTSKDPLAEIQNRNEVGNLHFAAGSYQKAEQFWEDSLATIFKTVRPVDNYAQILKQKKIFLVNEIGQKQTILSLNLLYKIAKYGSFQKLYYQYNCTKFASKLANCLFEGDSCHPQSLLGHASYRITKLFKPDTLEDEATINLSELISSLQFFSLRMIDMGNSIQSLPMLNLYEHLAVDIIKNPEQSVRVKLIKAIALANCGLISQSLLYLAKIANQKDLPNIWIDPSDQMKREKGCNWYFEDFSFDNSKPWSDATNKEAIEFIKKLTLKTDFVTNYGLTSLPIFNYLRGLILTKIFSHQIYDNYENNELRIANLQEAENIMRDALKKLAILDEHYANLEEIEKAKLKLNKNQISDDAEKAVEAAKNASIAYLKASGIQEPLFPRYQSQKPTSIKKEFRVEFMIRIRFTIHQSYSSRRLNSNSFHVLKNGLTNIHRISYGSRKVETGYDPEIGIAQPQQPAAKKDDKKGGKKEEENVEVPKEQINWQKQKQKQLKAQQSSSRTSINLFWHIKVTYEIGKLMYQQNRFKSCKILLQKLIEEGRQYLQYYYSIFAQGFILRCDIRLGKFQLPKFYQIIGLAFNKEYERQDLLDLVMDLGEILKNDKSIQLFQKGRNIASKLWEELGMKSRLSGIDLTDPQRLFSGKQELTQEQEEQIKRKSKKVDKKGGKDDKKAAKKEDPKKKKQENKAEYKVELLSKYEWWNLLDEQKQSFENYIIKPHPNFYPNNIYNSLALQYIKCYTRHLQMSIERKFNQQMASQLSYIKKLLKIVETYPTNGYYHYLHLYFCAAEINKNAFLSKLKDLILRNKGRKIKTPYGDLPLNSDLISLPQYSQFIYDNRSLLEEAQGHYKKIVALIKGNCLLFDDGFKLDQVLWKAADNYFYLAEYNGRVQPKFFPAQQIPNSETHSKLLHLNHIGQGFNQIDLSIKVAACLNELYCNYTEMGSKPLEAAAKIDQDITQQINEIDKEFKANYSKLLSDSLKPKQGVNSLELLTYLSKMHREAELMTFANPQVQNVILRCHRILLTASQPYKDKCIVNNVEYVPKKTVDEKVVELASICIKSKLSDPNQEFLYVFGGQQKEHKPYYGRLSIQSVVLSAICERLYQIRSKMAISQKKSEQVKNRDFLLYQKQLRSVLIEIGKMFYPTLNEIPEAIKISLTVQNISALVKMFQSSGTNTVNKQINTYFRHLHQLKYKTKPPTN